MNKQGGGSSQKKGFWDLIHEGSKGLGILFPGENKQSRRSSVSVPKEVSMETEAVFSEEKVSETTSPNFTNAARVPVEKEWDFSMKNEEKQAKSVADLSQLERTFQQSQASLNETTQKHLKEIQDQLNEIRRAQADQQRSKELAPVVVENALEKFFYWVQERDNNQMDSMMKEAEQRLNSGQLEILMELRSLVDQTDKMALAEQKIAILEKQEYQQKVRFKILLVALIFLLIGIAGILGWLWQQGFLVLYMPWLGL